ncbi:MAG: cupin domain-containing protein [Alphaproteobacteria bacterium]|nr:cupin domain-containing protein [Alphaproteobacteria bacterium]
MASDDKIKLEFRLVADQLLNSAETSAKLFERDDISVLLYVPKDTDTQTPHARDELYIVVAGYGTFRRGKELVRFSPGDVLFVAAGVPHRFESFSGDFRTWVVFFGKKQPAGE